MPFLFQVSVLSYGNQDICPTLILKWFKHERDGLSITEQAWTCTHKEACLAGTGELAFGVFLPFPT